MNKLLKNIFFLCPLLLLMSCAPQQEPPSDFTVVVTFYPVYLAAANITNDMDGVSVKLLTQPDTGCLHDYQLTPGELESIKGADLVLALGSIESFLSRVKQAYPDIPLVECGNSDNEHSWVFVNDYINMVNQIGSAIINADPDRVEVYESNLKTYLDDLAQLAEDMEIGMTGLDNSPVIMFHEGFDSWSVAYGLNIVATIESEPGVEPTPREFAETLDLAQETGVKVLFTEPQYSGAAAYTIARETGAKVYELDPVAGGADELDHYQKAMRRNVETVRAALGDE